MRPSILLTLLTLSACAHAGTYDDLEPLDQESSDLSFVLDPQSTDRWQLWWHGERDEVLRYKDVVVEQQSFDTAHVFYRVDPERQRYRSWKSSCEESYRPYLEDGDGDDADRVERMELHGAGALASWRADAFEPGNFRVTVARSDEPPISAEFTVDGLNQTQVDRLGDEVADIKAGACATRSGRPDDLSKPLSRRIMPETLAAMFEQQDLWPSSMLAPERKGYLNEIAQRNATINYFGVLVVASKSPPVEHWEVARAVHQPFFVQWLAPRLDPQWAPTGLGKEILEKGAWTPAVMDYVANRIDLLRNIEHKSTAEAEALQVREQERDMAYLLRVAPNEFGDFYPEHQAWIDSEFTLGFSFGCGGSRVIGCSFPRPVAQCEHAIADLRARYRLDSPSLPTLRDASSPELLLGI